MPPSASVSLCSQDEALGRTEADEDAEAAPKKAQEEKLPETLKLQEEPSKRSFNLEGSGFIDFDWLEIHPRIGIAMFTDDFHIDPSPQISLLMHAPMPWLSPGSNPGGDYFGVWAELTLLPSVTRDIEPEPDQPSGTCFFVSLGFDFTFLRNQSLYLILRGGGLYGMYGGITDLTDGFGSTAGLDFGIYLGGKVTLTLGGQSIFGNAGDRIDLASLGMVIEF